MIYKQVVFFVMKSSETNDTNTYLHTLSPHDALPISLGQPQVEQGEIEGGGVELLQGFLTGPDHFDLGGAVAQQHVLDVEGQERVVLQRSEEHTSELQSLMRISYAGLCLKKKTHYEMKVHYNSCTNSLRQRYEN